MLLLFNMGCCLTSLEVGHVSEDKAFWSKIVTKILKAELAKRGIDYATLIKKLNDINVSISAEDLRGRMSRGTFSAIFLIQCLKAIGVKNLPLEDSYFET